MHRTFINLKKEIKILKIFKGFKRTFIALGPDLIDFIK